MGEVYRARDSKLQRDVAVKVLRPEFAADPDRLARFEREARLLAALNHPHIASIYGLEESAGAPALIMELVEGPTLADRLIGGPLPLDDALAIARQISEALEYAHEQGIVHRDLKPANVKVAPDESVKVLDFGLAKALGQDPEGSQPSNSPTVTMPTRAGVVLGTAAYMAPEQAKGRPVDRRADIWAFGCVLYEMLAGTPAFRGETVTDILAAVIREDPDWTRLPSGTPLRLRELLRRCLTKDVRQRMQAIGDVRIALEEIGSGDRAAETVLRTSSWRAWLVPAAAGGAIVAAIAVLRALTAASGPPTARPVTSFTIPLPPGQHLSDLSRPAIALSPDGRLLAYVADTEVSGTPKVYVRAMDGLESRPVGGTDGANTPFFSPDSQWLGFFADGKLKKVPVGGGDAQVLAEAVNSIGASWAAGSIAFAPYGSVIQQVPDAGGPVTALSRFQPGETEQDWPEWLPDGRSALFVTSSLNGQSLVLQRLGSADRPEIRHGPRLATPRYVVPGYLVYAADGDLVTVPFDLQHPSANTATPATSVVKGVYAWQYAISATGTLAYVSGRSAPYLVRLVMVDRHGVVKPLGAPAGGYNQPRLSPDGTRLAVDVFQKGMQIWLYDLRQDTFKPFTFDGVNRHAVWTRDSKRLVYTVQDKGITHIVSQPSDGSSGPEALTADTGENATLLKIPESLAADGTLTYTTLFASKRAEVWALKTGTGSAQHGAAAQLVMEARTADGGQQWSPDGHWLAYASEESGSGRQIYVRAFPGPGGPWQVSLDGGNEPMWNPRGGELFYRSGNRMMAAEVNTTAGFSAGKPHELFRGDFILCRGGYARANYDVSADGQHFLMLQPVETGEEPPRQITVVLNWLEELKRLVPTGPPN